ncbi:MAG: peptidylprolyl isomerase [Acidobacteriaceae bacterium]
MRRALALAVVMVAMAGRAVCSPMAIAQRATLPANGGQFVELDHVVAVINGDVLLESDVEEEMHFAALEPFRLHAGKDTRQDAMHRLISRSLIVQQMRQQRQFNVKISDADVQKSLKELRSHLPECAAYKCQTEEGWKSFLTANDLTEQEVVNHWQQRLAILRFIDLRFRTGIRISHESIAEYYQKAVVPAFEKQHQSAPALKDVSSRIEEVLLEQQVNGLLQDWLKSLRAEGSVQIVDPAYANAEDALQASEED